MINDTDIPVTKILRPTAEEFNDFAQFVEKLDQDQLFSNYGIIKVKNWQNSPFTRHFRLFPLPSGRHAKLLTTMTLITYLSMLLSNKMFKENQV